MSPQQWAEAGEGKQQQVGTQDGVSYIDQSP